MRVLITGETLHGPTTGVQRATIELANAIAARGDVDLSVLLSSENDGVALDPAIHRIVRRIRITAGIVPGHSVPHRLLSGFDVVHCPTARVPFLRKPDTRTIITIHDLVPLAAPQTHQLTYRLYFRTVLPRALQRFDHIVASSESTRNDLQKFYEIDRSRISVVLLACGWRPLEALEVVREKEPFFLWVGTLEPRKNLQRTIDAFAAYRSRSHAQERLLVVGARGWGRSRISLPEGVEVLGYVDDPTLRSLFRRAKALVYPSLYEGFGFPVLEAMTQGCPVIASRSSSLPEVAGDAAIYCDPLDATSIAGAMARVSDPELRERMIEKGLSRAAGFSWQRTAAEMVAIYRGASR
ncbi:MAG TPA: glycosyltransferase family 1 protein [Thermoanaerobaculia bacterium]|nr:glycosyltransferase family 1 protein [Thermoanaerobaculia bacterium]